MASYPYKQHTTTRSFTYNYIAIPSSNGKPTILFLHGFPSSPSDYRHQIQYFSKHGYGIIAPTLLGYGKTSKPLDYRSYSGKGMSLDVKDILDHEGIAQVIAVAHDWGSFLLSRLVNYYPSLFTKVVFLEIGYLAPGFNLNRNTINFVNAMTQANLGYSIYGFFLFFEEEDAAELMKKQVMAVASLFHSRDEDVVKNYLGAPGGTRTWFEEGMTADCPAYFTEEDKAAFSSDYAPENGAFTAVLNWVRAQLNDINAEEEESIPEDHHKIRSPTLLISTSYVISATADFPDQMKSHVPNLELKKIDAGHYVMMEKPDETNEILAKFFEK